MLEDSYYCYKIKSPIIFDYNIQTISQAVELIAQSSTGIDSRFHYLFHHSKIESIKVLITNYQSALKVAEKAGYKYDSLSQEPRLFWLPNTIGFMQTGFIFHKDKEDSFIISPIRLPHLDEPVEE